MKNIKTTNEPIEQFLADNENHSFKILAELLLNAINDWPEITDNKIENFIIEFKAFYSENITIENINSKKIHFNQVHNSWRAESGSQIIEMLEEAKIRINETNFDIIIAKILKYYSKNNNS